jgi:polyhydroxybutyrate depolymerase
MIVKIVEVSMPLFSVTILMLLSLIGPDKAGPGDHDRTVIVDGLTRSYLVHIPPGYKATSSMPVVLAYHGGGANADNMVIFSGLNKKADEAGFIVVYPNGTGRLARMLTFNAGNCCGYAMTNKIDDVEFAGKILDDLGGFVNIDKKRVFATGMSNGAIMAYRLAAELSDRIAAIAPVSGPMGFDQCKPTRPVSVIHFHGTADENAPFKGGKGKGPSGTNFYSVDHSIQAWVKANGCMKMPTVDKLPIKIKDGTAITRKIYGNGKDGAEVVLIEIEGGGHTWPGLEPRLKSLGQSTKNISANDMMWDFFEKHPMK